MTPKEEVRKLPEVEKQIQEEPKKIDIKEISDLLLAEYISTQNQLIIKIQNDMYQTQKGLDALITELNTRKALLEETNE